MHSPKFSANLLPVEARRRLIQSGRSFIYRLAQPSLSKVAFPGIGNMKSGFDYVRVYFVLIEGASRLPVTVTKNPFDSMAGSMR